MEKVYILYESYDDRMSMRTDVVGVYATQEAAIAAMDKQKSGRYKGSAWHVLEHKVIK